MFQTRCQNFASLCCAHLASISSSSQPTVAQSQSDMRWAHFTQHSDGLLSNNVWAALAHEDAVWFGTDNGIARYNGIWTSFPTSGAEARDADGSRMLEGPVRALAASATEGKLWAGTDSGSIGFWESVQGAGAHWQVVADVGSRVNSLHEENGQLWIGTEVGLYVLNGSEVTLVDALGRQPIYAVASDSGTVWVGAHGGLWSEWDNKWTQIDADEALLEGGVYALRVEPGGLILAGTPYGMAYRDNENDGWGLAETLDDLGESALVQAIAGANSGYIWAGSDGAGAFSFDLQAGNVGNAGFSGDPNLTTRFIRDIAIDLDGTAWFATPAGVFRYQQGMWFTDVQGASTDDPRNYINDLLLDREGQLWIATGGGGVRLKRGVTAEETVFAEEDGLPAAVLVLAQDASGAVWAGTFEGSVSL